MTNGYKCPAEGCDYGTEEEKTELSVTRHINARKDEAHEDSERLREMVGQSNADTGESDADADESDSTEDEMVTQQEYQDQHSDPVDAPTDGDEDSDEDSDEDAATGAALAPSLPSPSKLADTSTLTILVGAALVLLLAYLLLSGDSSDSSETVEQDGGEMVADSETVEKDEGGLVP